MKDWRKHSRERKVEREKRQSGGFEESIPHVLALIIFRPERITVEENRSCRLVRPDETRDGRETGTLGGVRSYTAKNRRCKTATRLY